MSTKKRMLDDQEESRWMDYKRLKNTTLLGDGKIRFRAFRL